MELRDRIAEIIKEGNYEDFLHESPLVLADEILALPEIAEALRALEREESYSRDPECD